MSVKKVNKVINCQDKNKETDHNHTEHHRREGDLILPVHQQLHQSLGKDKLLVKLPTVKSFIFGTAELGIDQGNKITEVKGITLSHFCSAIFHAYATPLSPSLTTFVWPSEVPVHNQMGCRIMYKIINLIQKGKNHSNQIIRYH